MIRAILSILGALVACALVVTGLYFWQRADDWALDWAASRPDLAAWAIRSAGVGRLELLSPGAGRLRDGDRRYRAVRAHLCRGGRIQLRRAITCHAVSDRGGLKPIDTCI
jgi:hypothetical protein